MKQARYFLYVIDVDIVYDFLILHYLMLYVRSFCCYIDHHNYLGNCLTLGIFLTSNFEPKIFIEVGKRILA
jgi:hypothetical protein